MKQQAVLRLSRLLVIFISLTIGMLHPSAGPHAERLFVRLDVPFLSQTVLREQEATKSIILGNGDSSTPLWEYGCGVASLAMVYRFYSIDTDIVRLNDTLRQNNSNAFSGAFLVWNKSGAFLEVGRPWIQGVEAVSTSQPKTQQARVDQELTDGHPVIAFLGNQHYVVLTGKDDSGNYFINDPWFTKTADGKDILLEQNALKLKFDQIRQFVFVHPDRNTPTNGILVTGSIADKYYALGGSKSSLGNPIAPQETLADSGLMQRFEQGAILSSPKGVYALHGPVWQKFEAAGGVAKLGLPHSDTYTYYVGPSSVEWRADFVDASILWTEGDRPDAARILTAQNSIQAEYFANSDLQGSPTYKRLEEDLLFNWQQGAPGPWVDPDGFSARFVTTIKVGGVGWFYNFMMDADDGARLRIDDRVVLDAWAGGGDRGLVRTWLPRGDHTLQVEYRELQKEARLLVAYSPWPIKPVFAAESEVGTFAFLPAPAPVDEIVATPTPPPVSVTGLSAENVAPLVYDVVLPGETAILKLEVRNSGDAAWAGADFSLASQGGSLAEIPTALALDTPVAPTESTSWNIQIPVSGAPGVRTARYQMQYRNQPFGDVVTAYVVILPEPLKDAEQRIRDRIEEWQRQGEQAAEEIIQRTLDEIQQEVERQATDFIDELLAQCPSASVTLGLALAVVYRNRRHGKKP